MIVDLVNVAKMETNKKHLIVYSILGVLIALFFGITIHQCSNPKVKYVTPPPERIHDTIIRDSIQIQEKVKWKYVTKYDTAIYIQHDTFLDTIYVQLPINHYQYRDTGGTDSSKYNIGINYSGYRASLDSVWFNYSYTPQTIVQTKRNGWGQYIGIGVQVGIGSSINARDKTFVTGPYVGVGVTYGFGYHW